MPARKPARKGTRKKPKAAAPTPTAGAITVLVSDAEHVADRLRQAWWWASSGDAREVRGQLAKAREILKRLTRALGE